MKDGPIELYGEAERVRLRRAGRAAAETLAYVAAEVAPGITTADIDALVREHTQRLGGRPSQLGYHGFPAAVCTSVNHVVCHGIPSRSARLAPGDIVNVDVTTELDGFHGDTSATLAVGEVGEDARTLVAAVEEALGRAIAVVRPGARLGDIGAAVEAVAARTGTSVVREYGGHGIGRRMHMPPHVSHVGRAGQGLRLKPGMAFTIEPMLNRGKPGVRLLPDGWTVVTVDGALSAQCEHTVLVTETGVEVLTLRP
jgi:methionyl aminopeptidase